MLEQNHIERITFFSMLADEVRYAIINCLLELKKAAVSQLIKQIKKPQTLISYHLRCLRDCDILKVKKPSSDKRKRFYYLHDEKMIRTLFFLVDDLLGSINESEKEQYSAFFEKELPIRAQFFTMIKDEVRHRILILLLNKREATVSEILMETKRAQTLVSYHLRCLRDCGLLDVKEDDKDKRKRVYYLRNPRIIKAIFNIADDFLKAHQICKDYPACRTNNRASSSTTKH